MPRRCVAFRPHFRPSGANECCGVQRRASIGSNRTSEQWALDLYLVSPFDTSNKLWYSESSAGHHEVNWWQTFRFWIQPVHCSAGCWCHCVGCGKDQRASHLDEPGQTLVGLRTGRMKTEKICSKGTQSKSELKNTKTK